MSVVQKRFAAHVSDERAMLWLGVLQSEFRMNVFIVSRPGEKAPKDCHCLFSSPGRYPSKHLRRLCLPKDVTEHGFLIPDWTADSTLLFALQDTRPISLTESHEAIRQLAYLSADGTRWIGPTQTRGERRRMRDNEAIRARM